MKQSNSRGSPKKGAKTQPQVLRKKTIYKKRFALWAALASVLLAGLILSGILLLRAGPGKDEIVEIGTMDRISGWEQYIKVPAQYVVQPDYSITGGLTRFALSGTIDSVAEVLLEQLEDAARIRTVYDEAHGTGFILLDFSPRAAGRYFGIFFCPPQSQSKHNRYMANYTDLWADFGVAVPEAPYSETTVVSVLFPWHLLQNYQDLSRGDLNTGALDREVATLGTRADYLSFYDTLWQYTAVETETGFLLYGCSEQTLSEHTGTTQFPEWYPAVPLEFVFDRTDSQETLLIRTAEQDN